ncbi:MAG: hypothetical protein K8H88_06870 [Sandaracinaceae bacterium]|nr:hypothetical protein [Sandaracinaceae bacterium]
MPELPEVERAAVDLRAWCAGSVIERARVPEPRILLEGTTARGLSRALAGRRVEAVERRGKQLLVALDGGTGLSLHLGMSGKIICFDSKDELPRFARLVLELGSRRVALRDPRVLARASVGPLDALRAKLARLGPDALDVKDAASLRACLGGKPRAIKIALMDQKRLAGIGNIQATEALWLARLSPYRPATELEPAEWRRLARAVQESLSRTLAQTLNGKLDYLSEGAKNLFHVYGRKGEPCPRCEAALVAGAIEQRTTVYCARCQT